MIKIELDELMKAIALIDLTNSVPLNEIVWTKAGQQVSVSDSDVSEWKFIGLSNTYFAREWLMTPNAKLRGATDE